MKKLFYLFLVIGLFSCNTEPVDINSNLESEFKGLWSGSFSGGDNGTWTLTVENTGTVVGSFTSKDHNEIYSIEGSVDENGEIQASIISETVVGNFAGDLNNNLSSGSYYNEVNDRGGDFQGRSSTTEESQIINHWQFYSSEMLSSDSDCCEILYYDDPRYCENLFMEFHSDGTFIDDFDAHVSLGCIEPQYSGTFSVQDGYYEMLYEFQGGNQDLSQSDIYILYPDENTITYEYNNHIWTYKIDLDD